ncbi:hypothetical protein [Lacticaseibacillus daqingensis]|uniref:hypothetical protein n=1 Tax=Lacticaseibacillus daqingensis TaxID=2486014 RepID=UPI000F7A5F0C|nr:hypothetical protein [Lacticaseibacillus daqingensis]
MKFWWFLAIMLLTIVVGGSPTTMLPAPKVSNHEAGTDSENFYVYLPDHWYIAGGPMGNALTYATKAPEAITQGDGLSHILTDVDRVAWDQTTILVVGRVSGINTPIKYVAVDMKTGAQTWRDSRAQITRAVPSTQPFKLKDVSAYAWHVHLRRADAVAP